MPDVDTGPGKVADPATAVAKEPAQSCNGFSPNANVASLICDFGSRDQGPSTRCLLQDERQNHAGRRRRQLGENSLNAPKHLLQGGEMQAKNGTDPLSSFIERCRRGKLRVTPQRVAILRELGKSDDHPSAAAMFETIRKQFPNISFDTVNRTLLTFADIGIVDVVEGCGGPRRFDPRTEYHHHLHCIRCDTIIDFQSEDYDNLTIPEEIRRKFDVISKRVVLNIICDKCKEKE
jgi:Fur family peroxide stress response transcriptional regulator